MPRFEQIVYQFFFVLTSLNKQISF